MPTSYSAWSDIGARCLLLAAILGLLVTASQLVEAQTLTTLYSFQGIPDGAVPLAGVVLDSEGNLYGTTSYGGTIGGGSGCGTVFEVTPSGSEKMSYSITCNPYYAGLIRDDEGNLYGTTGGGGTGACFDGYGCGTVFKISEGGVETVLYSFTGGTDGVSPSAGLVMDDRGNLYGTTNLGGGSGCGGQGCGTVFKVTATGAETVLYRFAGGTDAYEPMGGQLALDREGNLYGVTEFGGAYGVGALFKVTPTGIETIVHSFAEVPDGNFPFGTLLINGEGYLYGTTMSGGAHGRGTVFEVTPSGEERVLYSFCPAGEPPCPDGQGPLGGLVRDLYGNFYGTTQYGGASGEWGTVFKLTPGGVETVLYSFTFGADGVEPNGGLVLDRHGNLYGTTSAGGGSGCNGFGCGTVFKLTNKLIPP